MKNLMVILLLNTFFLLSCQEGLHLIPAGSLLTAADVNNQTSDKNWLVDFQKHLKEQQVTQFENAFSLNEAVDYWYGFSNCG